MIIMTEKEWLEKGTILFGERRQDWKFKCANCGTVQCGNDFVANGVPKDELQKGIVGFSCIGRFTQGKIGCDWTLGGLFQIHKAIVETADGRRIPVFEFAE